MPNRPNFTTTPPSDTKRLPALDGIRALAIIAVMLFHSPGQPLRGGFLGVDIFFVLSGYLITAHLAGRQELASYGSFVKRRLLRLYPALIVAVLLSFAALSVVGGFHAIYLLAAAASVGYFINELLAHGFKNSYIYNHMWSLSLEMQFYLFWGFVCTAALRRRVTREHLAIGCVAVAAGSLAIRVTYVYSGHQLLGYYSPESRLDALFLGCAFAFVAPNARILKVIDRPILGVLILAASLALFRETTPWASTCAAVGTVALLPSAIAGRGLVARVLGIDQLAWIGLISYSLYLWHFSIFDVAAIHFGKYSGDLGSTVFAWAASFIAAWLSYRYVESLPARINARRRRRNSNLTIEPAV